MFDLDSLDLSWRTASGRHRFHTLAGDPVLELPGGGRVQLPPRDWVALVAALVGYSAGVRPESGEAASAAGPAPAIAQPATPGFGGPVVSGPARRGQPWTTDEEIRVASAFRAGDGVSEIARATGRSRGAVAARLVALGLLDEAEAHLRYPRRRAEAPPSAVPEVPVDAVPFDPSEPAPAVEPKGKEERREW